MFKKTLVALALTTAAISANAATTATVSGKVDVFGKEFIANETTGIALSSIEVDLDAQYSAGDIVTLSIAGASIDTTNSSAAAAYTTDLTAAPTMTLGILSTEANKVTFRVTAAAGDHGDTEATKSSKITFTGLKLTTASAVASTGAISATFAAQTSTGFTIDAAASNTATVMKGVNQYNVKVDTALDETISVGSLRTNFGGTPTDYSDVVSATFADYTLGANEAAATGLMGAAPSATKVTLVGDFSFLDTNADGKITATDKIPLATAFVASGTATSITPAADLQSVSFVGPTGFGASGLTITAGNAAGDVTIKDQKFTVTTEATYAPKTGSATKATASLAAGEWDLDGSTDKIELMPFGSEYAQSITVANTGTVEGAITVTLTADGKEYTKTLDAVAAANSVTNISLEVAAFAAASGVTGNAHINVVVNAPEASIGVKGVYYHKASADRVLTH